MRNKVIIDGKKVYIFPGMKVRHLLSIRQIKEIESGKKEVYDRYGNIVGLDGALSNNMILRVKIKF